MGKWFHKAETLWVSKCALPIVKRERCSNLSLLCDRWQLKLCRSSLWVYHYIRWLVFHLYPIMEKKRFCANAWDAARREISIFTSRKSNRMHRRLSSVKVELSEKIGSHYVLLKIHIEELWHHQFLASQVCTHLTGNAFRWCSNLVDGKAKHNYVPTDWHDKPRNFQRHSFPPI